MCVYMCKGEGVCVREREFVCERECVCVSMYVHVCTDT